MADVGLTAYGTVPMLLGDVLYGLTYWPTVRSIVTFLATLSPTLADTYAGKLVSKYIDNVFESLLPHLRTQ